MRTNIPEKLVKISDDIGQFGEVEVTRLVVLKKWFVKPERLSAFAIWIAVRATSRKGKAGGAAAELFSKAKCLLSGVDKWHPKLDREKVKRLHADLLSTRNEHEDLQPGSIRPVYNRNLLLIEDALHIYVLQKPSPVDGYKLAADYCRNSDQHFGNCLRGPSQTKIEEIVRFMFSIEGFEGAI